MHVRVLIIWRITIVWGICWYEGGWFTPLVAVYVNFVLSPLQTCTEVLATMNVARLLLSPINWVKSSNVYVGYNANVTMFLFLTVRNRIEARISNLTPALFVCQYVCFVSYIPSHILGVRAKIANVISVWMDSWFLGFFFPIASWTFLKGDSVNGQQAIVYILLPVVGFEYKFSPFSFFLFIFLFVFLLYLFSGLT